VIVAADLSPDLLELCRSNVERVGLADRRMRPNDMASVPAVAGPFDLIMANHSLHHILELNDCSIFRSPR
jgi:methylase of polypeptide subunit release factors